jgi:hypothetical protein
VCRINGAKGLIGPSNPEQKSVICSIDEGILMIKEVDKMKTKYTVVNAKMKNSILILLLAACPLTFTIAQGVSEKGNIKISGIVKDSLTNQWQMTKENFPLQA